MFDGLKQLAIRLSPGPVIRLFAGPYVAGYSAAAAFERARTLLTEQGILSTIDLLGEEATDPESVERMKSTYYELIERISGDAAFSELASRPTLSLKLSGLVCVKTDGSGALAIDSAELTREMMAVAEAARAAGVKLTIDMEDHRWTDLTLEVFKAVYAAGHDHVGTVLQSRLFRTDEDIEGLPDGCRIRMVIGVYLEPAEIALTDKPAMKEKLLSQSKRLLEKGVTVELATHDERVVERFVRELVQPMGVADDRWEVQMLLGVPRKQIQRQLLDGSFAGLGRPATVRLYVPYALSASDASAYCRRRLIENPDMVTYGMLNLVRRR